MAKVYFVTGKGGTGKSSLARSLATTMASQNKKVLLLKINSFALSHEGDELPRKISENFWEQKMHQRRAVEEYFVTTLSKLPLPKSFSRLATRLQEGISSKLLANKFVMRFIDACPGLTPTIFLGKVCWEANEGGPVDGQKWDSVIVDAPSTGQALQVFESSKLLSRILAQGLIAKHIHETLLFAHHSDFEVHLITLPEEGPLQECFEAYESFGKLEKSVTQIWINKVAPDAEKIKLQSFKSEDPVVGQIVQTEVKRIEDQYQSILDFENKITATPVQRIFEHLEGESLVLEGAAT